MAIKKLYDYDEVMDYLNTGKAMDQAIQQLATDIKSLTAKVEECEEAFHGKGNKSIAKAYQALYNAIGSSKMEAVSGMGATNIGSGMWKNVTFAVGVCNTCYTNAERQKQNDEGDQAMQSFSGF